MKSGLWWGECVGIIDECFVVHILERNGKILNLILKVDAFTYTGNSIEVGSSNDSVIYCQHTYNTPPRAQGSMTCETKGIKSILKNA